MDLSSAFNKDGTKKGSGMPDKIFLKMEKERSTVKRGVHQKFG